MTDGDAVVILVTGPDRETLSRIGRRVVEERLAACVNLLEGVHSIYRWEGEVEEAGEVMAMVKTLRGAQAELEARVRELHPYDEPEFVALDITGGSRSYLAWVASCVGSPGDG